MTRRKAVIGLSLFSALFLCAVAAPNALALKGTTAFTCVPTGGEAPFYSDAHCATLDEKEGSFETKNIAGNTKVTATNNITGQENSTLKFTATVGGIKTKITATGFKSCANASSENKENGSGQMFVEGVSCGEFTGVTVSEPEKCQIESGKVTLNEGKFKSVVSGKGQEEMFGEFTPPGSGLFASFKFGKDEKCPAKGLSVEVKGAAKANVATDGGECVESPSPDYGATLHFTEAQTGKTLQVGGQKAEFEGTFTIRMGESENPVAINTTNS